MKGKVSGCEISSSRNLTIFIPQGLGFDLSTYFAPGRKWWAVNAENLSEIVVAEFLWSGAL